MSTFDRTTIIRGPAKIAYDSQVFYSKGAVTLTFTNSSFEKTADAYGLVGRGKTDFQAVVEFEPVGEIEALTVLFPYAQPLWERTFTAQPTSRLSLPPLTPLGQSKTPP